MTSEELGAALKVARDAQRVADEHLGTLVQLVVGRLRQASGYGTSTALVQMKRELQDFDMRTHRWKDR